MKNHSARTSLLLAGLVSRDVGRRQRRRDGSAQSHPDREREGRLHRLAVDQSRAPRRQNVQSLAGIAGRGVEAYASHTSIKAGETLNVHVST